jgi:hypothetical protein
MRTCGPTKLGVLLLLLCAIYVDVKLWRTTECVRLPMYVGVGDRPMYVGIGDRSIVDVLIPNRQIKDNTIPNSSELKSASRAELAANRKKHSKRKTVYRTDRSDTLKRGRWSCIPEACTDNNTQICGISSTHSSIINLEGRENL